MKTYEGRVHLIGYGTWQPEVTKLSVLEIGEKRIRNIYLPDYLRNYINANDNIRILTHTGFTKTSIVAVRRNGEKYTYGFGNILMSTILKLLLITFCGFKFILNGGNQTIFIILVCIVLYIYQIKSIIDFIRF